MALLKNAKGRKGNITESGYFRAFRNEKIAKLLSRAHSTVCSNGNELEKDCYRIFSLDPNSLTFTNPDDASEWVTSLSSVEYDKTICLPKKIYKNTIVFNTLNIKVEPDFIYYNNGIFFIEEKKDGDDFDTCKSKGEVSSLQKYTNAFKEAIEKYTQRTFEFRSVICLHNQENNDRVVAGLKNKACYYPGYSANNSRVELTNEYVKTPVYCINGRNFWNELKVDFTPLENARIKDGEENIDYFIEEVITILIDTLTTNTVNIQDNSINTLLDKIVQYKQLTK